MTNDTKNKPFLTIRDGGLKNVVWENKTEKGTMYNIVRVRSYKDKNDEWKETDQLSYKDLPKAALLDIRTYEAIKSKTTESKEEGE